MRVIQRLGARGLAAAEEVGAVARLLAGSLAALLWWLRGRRPASSAVLLRQIYFSGCGALFTISWTALLLGLLTVTESLVILARVDREGTIGAILIWVVRELGPLFTSVIVIARSGTAMAAELGVMRASGEIGALEVMGIDPLRYLIMPRILATGLSVFALTFYFDIVFTLGGYLFGAFGRQVTLAAYLESVLGATSAADVLAGAAKSLLFGLLIGAVCCRRGLLAHGSLTRIPQEATLAVMGSLAAVLVLDAVISLALYL